MPRRYPEELRAEVVSAVLDDGMTYARAARRFDLCDSTVKDWVVAATRHPDATWRELNSNFREQIAALEQRVDVLERDDARVERAAVDIVAGLVQQVKPAMDALLSRCLDEQVVDDLRERARDEWAARARPFGLSNINNEERIGNERV